VTERSDEELMMLYAKGSPEAFQELYGRYQNKLYGFLKKRIAKSHSLTADDLLQVTWLKAHSNRSKFDPNYKFSSWIYTIALNSLRDYTGLVRHEMEIASDEIEARSGDQNTLQDEIAIQQEKLDEITHMLELLPQVQRDILVLSDWEGFESKEIARMLGISDGAVRQKLFRARRFIKTKLVGDL
jgi:RNA polymerase sigma-70 factor (ECF subfamily)